MLCTKLSDLYKQESLDFQQDRYSQLEKKYHKYFPETEIRFFSSPGRTEISGNHTDHNHGKVVAASINLDSIAALQKNETDIINIYSEGFSEPFKINITNLDANPSEKETTNALIRGIAARFTQLGYNIGGFNAVITSDVLQGSGLSSSASIEVLVGFIFNNLFNEGKVSPQEIAKIGQYAENHYFGKPCGLMDQMACAVGNIISIDFKNPDNAIVTPISFDFSKTGYKLVVLDTGANHADLTDDYASIPNEMKEIAQHFGCDFCRQISEIEFMSQLPILREKYNHRAILRTLHFINENKRVDQMVEALKLSDVFQFLILISESGNSSFKYLQNIYSTKNIQEQGVSLALALTEKFLKKINAGACRVHGGGFAGTIQIFIPTNYVEDYHNFITSIFGRNSLSILDIRPIGVTEVDINI